MFFIDPTPAATQNGPMEWFLRWAFGLGWLPVIVGIWKVRGWLLGVETQIGSTIETIKNNGSSIKAVSDDQKQFKTIFEEHIKSDDEHFRALRESISEHVRASSEVVKSITQLTEAIHHQSDVHGEQFKIIRLIGEQQAILATNQTNITSGFQRVVEQLISMMKE